ncbi:MAG: IS1182 family transposase [Chloroflexi bacterium]|nr:IS1182 family transposase [Chloroflexota bacterium]OJV99153.1 MAG: DDE transposase [Chloroflexi bacterium 54-19]
MSLHPEPLNPIPSQTILVARAAFPKGSIYMAMRDELGTFYQDQDFAALFPSHGQHALAPWRLALVTVMQFVENLTDRQAATAVRARIDWKYALALELTDSGFDFSVLSEFRSRLVEGQAEDQLFELMLNKFKERGLLKAAGKQRTDSTHVVAAVRELNRTEGIAETLRAALNALATVAPTWLRQHTRAEWFERYAHRVEEYRLPKGVEARTAYMEVVGNDGIELLQAIFDEVKQTPLGITLRQLEAVEILRQMWIQHYYFLEGQLHLRDIKEVPPTAKRIESPYDIEARYSEKRDSKWTGYKVHLSESCEEGQPHLITNLLTTQAQVPDVSSTDQIQQSLIAKGLKPSQHLVDMGYTNIDLLLTTKQKYDFELVGPMRPDNGWQAAEKNGFGAANFEIDWQNHTMKCPMGKTAKDWKEGKDYRDKPVVHVRFARADCAKCESRLLCTRSVGKQRALTLRPKEQHQALQIIRLHQQGEEFKESYSLRAGVESTMSQGVNVLGLRRSRYIGLEKTSLQHFATGAAMNLVRIIQWLCDSNSEDSSLATLGQPKLRTRPSAFGALALTA